MHRERVTLTSCRKLSQNLHKLLKLMISEIPYGDLLWDLVVKYLKLCYERPF